MMVDNETCLDIASAVIIVSIIALILLYLGDTGCLLVMGFMCLGAAGVAIAAGLRNLR